VPDVLDNAGQGHAISRGHVAAPPSEIVSYPAAATLTTSYRTRDYFVPNSSANDNREVNSRLLFSGTGTTRTLAAEPRCQADLIAGIPPVGEQRAHALQYRRNEEISVITCKSGKSSVMSQVSLQAVLDKIRY
jgi:hypothetical protein